MRRCTCTQQKHRLIRRALAWSSDKDTQDLLTHPGPGRIATGESLRDVLITSPADLGLGTNAMGELVPNCTLHRTSDGGAQDAKCLYCGGPARLPVSDRCYEWVRKRLEERAEMRAELEEVGQHGVVECAMAQVYLFKVAGAPDGECCVAKA
ncbi:hypothetical protein HDV05_006587 [Chytridiales sp. JEL 0842]|nr:hypothetical protein HDV05_006587 [Chytridiales sp. JEL 0842]